MLDGLHCFDNLFVAVLFPGAVIGNGVHLLVNGFNGIRNMFAAAMLFSCCMENAVRQVERQEVEVERIARYAARSAGPHGLGTYVRRPGLSHEAIDGPMVEHELVEALRAWVVVRSVDGAESAIGGESRQGSAQRVRASTESGRHIEAAAEGMFEHDPVQPAPDVIALVDRAVECCLEIRACQPIERIQEMVAAHYGLTVAKLTSASREQKVALPRQIAMYLCRILAEEKLQAIAEKFNKKDHTTVISAIDRVKSLIETDEQVRVAIQALTSKLAP